MNVVTARTVDGCPFLPQCEESCVGCLELEGNSSRWQTTCSVALVRSMVWEASGYEYGQVAITCKADKIRVHRNPVSMLLSWEASLQLGYASIQVCYLVFGENKPMPFLNPYTPQ